ncbi:MAG: hypothetical protein MZV64_33620 [Ignavibacteriales bacterium]|nr:hypothetical protein [Ignavibacteriales bacterium]
MVIFWGFRKHYKHGRHDRAPEGQVRGPQVPGRRADPRADQASAWSPSASSSSSSSSSGWPSTRAP